MATISYVLDHQQTTFFFLLQAQRFVRHPYPEEWTRFLKNAARLKTLSISKHVLNIDPDLFPLLAIYRPRLHLFPNVQALHWHEYDEILWQYFGLFLGPALQRIAINQDDEPPDEYTAAIKQIPQTCPGIKSLDLNYNEDFVDVWDDLGQDVLLVTSQVVAALPKLEEFSCNTPLSREAVNHLASLPSLRSLTFKIDKTTPLVELPVRRPTDMFPALENINVEMHTLADPMNTRLILEARSNHLDNIVVSTLEAPTRESFILFCQGLANRPGAIHTSGLGFTFPKRYIIPHDIPELPGFCPDMILTIDSLQPLFYFKNLTVLEITSYYLDIDDAAVSLIASTFPGLTSLRLLPNFTSAGRAYKTTTTSLITCALKLPHLEELGLAFDTKIQPYHFDTHVLPTQLCSTLCVADSRLGPESVGDMALLLSAFFWNVELNIDVASEDEVAGFERETRVEQVVLWRRVQEVHLPMVMARRQERLGAMSPELMTFQQGIMVLPTPATVGLPS